MMHDVNRARSATTGATFANNFTNWPLCCPSRATFYTGQYAHNHGVLGNSPPDGGFDQLRRLEHAAGVAAAGRLPHDPHRQVPERLRDRTPATRPTCRPGWNEWYAADGGTTQTVYDYELNQNGTLSRHGRRRPARLQAGRVHRPRRRRDQPQRSRRPVLPGRHVHGAACGRPEPEPAAADQLRRHGQAGAPPRDAFDAEPLPLPPNFNEADVSDKPLAIQGMAPIDRRRGQRPSARATAAGSSRCCRSTRASGGSSTRSSAAGELDDTLIVFTSDNGFFAGEHRVHDRQEPRLRGGDPGPAGDPRPGRARRA